MILVLMLQKVLDLYNGLESYLVQIRDDFDIFENKAVEFTGCSTSMPNVLREKKREWYV